MYDLDKVYTKKFFRQRARLAWRAPIMVNAIQNVLEPRSVVDVGCGNGDLVKEFIARNVPAFGIEGTENVLKVYPDAEIFDLRTSIKQDDEYRRRDLALCLEVAEHIEEQYVENFIDNLCQLSDRILFSAASPGQGGLKHVNCKSQEYWWYKFNARSYVFKRNTTNRILSLLAPYKHKKGIKAYYQNLMYFEFAGII